jgi:hypothetical protein
MLAAATFAAAGCVTTYEDAPLFTDVETPVVPATAMTIPFGDDGSADQRLLYDFYGGVFQRLQAAAEERDVAQVEALLAAYRRPGLPVRLQDVLRGYAAMASGLRFQQHAVRHSSLQLEPDPASAGEGAVAGEGPPVEAPPIGAPFTCRLTMAPPPAEVRLGARTDDDPCGFAVTLSIDDTFVDGSTRSTQTQDFVWLPAAFAFASGQALALPIGLDVAASDAVRRVVRLRVDLMPGYVQIDGERVPVQRTAIGAVSLTQWPAGYQAIVRAPLLSLREALRLGDAAHFPHVFVAASFVRGDDRQPAIALLIEQVRFGRQDQALVAMAALRELTGESLPAGDRQAWLAWWQARR